MNVHDMYDGFHTGRYATKLIACNTALKIKRAFAQLLQREYH